MSRHGGDNCAMVGIKKPIGARSLGQMGERAAAHEHVRIPDEEHVQICLNCTRKRCTGYCNRVRNYGKRYKTEEGQ